MKSFLKLFCLIILTVAWGCGTNQPGMATPSPMASQTPAAPVDPRLALQTCEENLKKIGTGLEMWSTDHENRYPSEMTVVAPNYIREIPICPAANKATYVAEFGPTGFGNSNNYADYYIVRCAGGHHSKAGVRGDFPAYNGVQGAIPNEESLKS